MQIEQAVQYFLNAKKASKAPSTAKWYESKLKPFIQFFEGRGEIEQLTIHDLNVWAVALADQTEHYLNHPYKKAAAEPMSQNTRRGYIRAIRTFFKWAAKPSSQILTANPAIDLDMPAYVRMPRTGISEPTRDLLIQAASGNPRDYAILMLLAATGCRLGGIATLTLDRLHLNNRKAIIREKGLGGANKYRTVYFNPETTYALAAYLVSRPQVDISHVFIGYRRGGKSKVSGWKPLATGAIYSMIKRYAKPLGVKLWNPHNWRHGYARGATRRGIPLQTLAQLLGHSSYQVTADIYSTLSDDELQTMADTYTWLNKPIAVRLNPTI